MRVFFLPENRDNEGQLAFYDSVTGLRTHGPWRCLGKASRTINGTPHTNTKLLPTLEFGNTPVGKFKVLGFKGPDDTSKYGLYPRLQLVGISGDALIRENVANNTIRVHAGRVRPNGKLIVTLGCIRVDEPTMLIIYETIIKLNIEFPFELIVEEREDIPLIVGCDPSQDADPSPV